MILEETLHNCEFSLFFVDLKTLVAKKCERSNK